MSYIYPYIYDMRRCVCVCIYIYIHALNLPNILSALFEQICVFMCILRSLGTYTLLKNKCAYDIDYTMALLKA